jgi:hypothetical protein
MHPALTGGPRQIACFGRPGSLTDKDHRFRCTLKSMSLSGRKQHPNRCSLRLHNLNERRVMKSMFFTFFALSLLSGGWLATSFGIVRQANPISCVLQAHGFSSESTADTGYAAVATKLMPHVPYKGSTRTVVQTVSMFAQGERLRYDTVTVLTKATVTESYLFDGDTYHHSVAGLKEQVNTFNQVGDFDSRLTLQRMRMFGLQPFLRELRDPRTQVEDAGPTVAGYKKFKIRSAAGSWLLFADQSGLIARIEIGSRSIVFSEYHSVNGVQLPFNEKAFNDERLCYELRFIELDPQAMLDEALFDPNNLPR